MKERSYVAIFLVLILCTQSFITNFPRKASTIVRNSVNPIEEFFQYKSDRGSINNVFKEASTFGKDIVKNTKVPFAKDEGWRTLSVRKLFDPSPTKRKRGKSSEGYESNMASLSAFVNSYVDQNNSNSVITFLDGEYSPSLSSHSDIPRSIWTTSKDHSNSLWKDREEEIKGMLQEIPQPFANARDSYGSDRLMGFNLMHMKDLIYIHVPNHTHLQHPVQLIFCQTNLTTSAISFPRVLISLGENATLNVFHSHISYTNHTAPVVVLQSTAAKKTRKEFVLRLRGDLMRGVKRGGKDVDEEDEEEEEEDLVVPEEVPEEVVETTATTDSNTPSDTSDEDETAVEASSEVEPVESESEGSEEKQRYFVAGGTVVHLLGSRSHCRHVYMQDLAMDTRAYEVVAAKVMGRSVYDSYFLQCGASMHRLNVHVDLMHYKANTTVNGIMLSEAKQLQDIHSRIVHAHNTTFTNQQERVIVGDYGTGAFKGMIHMPGCAIKSDAEQLCRGIISGEKSTILAVPSLNISADDVKCSHGVAIADLNENELFYLTTRGLNRQIARSLLSEAFALQVLPKILPRDHVISDRVITKLRKVVPAHDKLDLKSIQGIESL